MKPFELRSLPNQKKPRLYLCQLPYKTGILKEVTQPTTLAALDGDALKSSALLIIEMLGDQIPGNGSNPLDSPFTLAVDEEVALKIGLIASGINGLRSEDRIQKIISTVQAMSARDAAFWLDGITGDVDGRMVKAFRVAMTGDA